MSKFKFALNVDGVRELRQSQEMIGVLSEYANGVIQRCSGNYEISPFVGKSRANVSIYTSDWETYGKNLKNNEVLKAL